MFAPPRLFVHEFVTGGGWPPGELPYGLAAEGGAMLRAVLADFRAWGAVHTVTTLDPRLADLPLPADDVVGVPPGQHAAVFAALLGCSDAALIIAPETGGTLARLNATAQDAGVPLLGSSPAAVAIAGDKWACYQRFRQAGLPTPVTRRTSFADTPQVAREIGYPLVTKPVDGVGCEGVCLVANETELAAALAVLSRATRREEILLQSFVAGTHASVSLLVAEGQALPLSLNGQEIATGCPFAYRGGVVPLSHPAATSAFAVARAAVGLLPGLQGYVGVDLVLLNGEAWLMDINPRLTTSYIGLRRVLQLNLAQAIWQACRQGVLPEKAPITGQFSFSKDNLWAWEAAI
ncbi:MAG: ATP-grasp domain-containing protein [Chloroflexi bacterium]|nr:ATP-grasp domain-containing protein [Chloroflexota bacterium]